MFVKSFDSVLAPLENDEWYGFIAAEDRGETIDNPYLSIHSAMASYGQKKMEQYEDVEVNIWLMKGVHHYIYCFDETSLEDDAYIMDYFQNSGKFNLDSDYMDMSILCSDSDSSAYGYVDDDYDRYYSLDLSWWAPWIQSMGKIVPEYDNVRWNFRAMTCDESRF